MLQVLPRTMFALVTAALLAMLAIPADAREGVARRTSAASPTVDTSPRPVTRLEAGLEITKDAAPEGWSHLLLYAIPRVASGDVQDLPRVFGRMAVMFKLTVVADVRRGGGRRGDYVLRDIGIGFAKEVGGREVVVTTASLAESSGLEGVITRRVLEGNEKCLDEVLQVSRTPTMSIFDAEANMLRDGKHEKMVCRHAVLVSPRTGDVATCVWLLAKDRNAYKLAERSMRLLPPGLHEDRELNVETDLFVLGVPTPDALALVELPEGDDVRFTRELSAVAATKEFTPEISMDLEAALRGALEERPAGGE
jgi:hypothetical protein